MELIGLVFLILALGEVYTTKKPKPKSTEDFYKDHFGDDWKVMKRYFKEEDLS